MNTPQCEVLFNILVFYLRQCGAKLDGDNIGEIRSAVEGIDDLFTDMTERLDQQKALIIALESQLERIER